MSLLFQWRKMDIRTLPLPFQSRIEDHGMFYEFSWCGTFGVLKHEAFQVDIAILRELQIARRVGMAT